MIVNQVARIGLRALAISMMELSQDHRSESWAVMWGVQGLVTNDSSVLCIKFIPAITSQFRRTDLQPLEVVGCEGASIHTCDSHSRLQLWSSGARMVKWRDFSLEQPTLCDAASHAGDQQPTDSLEIDTILT